MSDGLPGCGAYLSVCLTDGSRSKGDRDRSPNAVRGRLSGPGRRADRRRRRRSSGSGGSSRPRHHAPRSSASPVALAVPPIFHGTPLRPGSARPALLFLGGDGLRLLSVGQRARDPCTDVWPGSIAARDPLGPDPAVQQVAAVAGGVVALISSHGSAGLADAGGCLHPGHRVGAGAPRVSARGTTWRWRRITAASGLSAPGRPGVTGRPGSPAWLVDRPATGCPVSFISVTGSWSRPPSLACWYRPLPGADADRPGQRPRQAVRIPQDAIIAGADAGHVAWQPAFCTTHCPLHVTSLRGGLATKIGLPPHTALNPGDTPDFDPAGQHLALPLDTIDQQGETTGTNVYVADLSARTMVRVPGRPIPVATLPAVPGAFPAGSSDVVSARWAADDSGLWIVATDGLFFQAAYWAGTGPLHVLQTQTGLAYKFDIAGASTPGP